ncbi:MAG: choice-of-anchor J domain-containing protein [Bacteroidota bacterium]
MQFKALRYILLSAILIGFQFSFAQGPTRSGSFTPKEDATLLRQFPCGGTTVLDVNFDDEQIPTNWQILDLDGATPATQIQFIVPDGGWQIVKDFKDTTSGNLILASPSWYDTRTVSEDWLITDLISALPGNTCLSWYAYSQDPSFAETYEVWITNTGSTTNDFISNGTKLLTVEGESNELNYRSLNLSAYAGQDVYLAFRHTSDDKFVLALDDIRLAEVETVDLGLFSIDEIRAKANETITITGAIINQGSDTLSFDSAAFEVFYSIDAQDTFRYAFPRLFDLAPNDTITFVHDSLWIPTENKVFRLEFWINQFPGDNNTANDTIGRWQGIGTATSVGDKFDDGFRIYPNPSSSVLTVEWENILEEVEIRMINTMGQKVKAPIIRSTNQARVDVSGLPRGLYFLQIRENGQSLGLKKILVE